jgi:uncharacterized protein (DUF58 family)
MSSIGSWPSFRSPARPADGVARAPRVGIPELTRRGWTFAGGAGGLLVGSRLLGSDALGALALGAGALLAMGFIWVSRQRATLNLERSLQPVRVNVGGDGRMLLHGYTTNASPWLNITESVDSGRRAARFALVPLAAGTPVEAGYRIPTQRRGRHVVGPTFITATDPFGLVRRNWAVGGTTEVIVRPRVHTISPPKRGGGGEPAERATGPRVPVVEALGDFLALRPYEPGDDPRRVHWPSSARHGDLLVRVDEAPAPGRAVILLDTRDAVYDEASFETAIEAAASIATSLHRSHQPVEVVTTAGETFRRPGASALDLILDRLAVVEPGPEDHLHLVTAALRNRLGLGGVVVITGAPDAAIVDAAAALGARRIVTIVATRPNPIPTGSIPVVDAARQPFVDAWNSTVHTRTRWHPANFRSRSHSPR